MASLTGDQGKKSRPPPSVIYTEVTPAMTQKPARSAAASEVTHASDPATDNSKTINGAEEEIMYEQVNN